MKQKILLILITLLTTVTTAWGFEVEVDGVNWTCEVIGETTNVKIKPANRSAISGAVTIPEIVTNDATDYTVTEIESYAFDYCSGLTAITVPNSVTKIGSWAFYNCSNLATYSGGSGVTVIEDDAFQLCSSLTSFTIPSGVTVIENNTFKKSGLTSIAIPASVKEIKKWAFEECGNLASVSIPASVTVIEDNPFLGCGNLSAITVDEGNPNYKAVGGVLFSKDDKTLIAYPNKSGTTYTIPASVTTICSNAFNCCSDLTSVTIPTGVTEIGDFAFSDCSGLTSVTIPTGVTNIKSNTFNSCRGLTSINIPASVTNISEYAFSGCSGLTSVTIPTGVTNIGRYAFFDCSGLTSVTIYAKELKEYGRDAFYSDDTPPTIYVFSDCVGTYQTGWNNQYTITAITDVTVSGVTTNENPGATCEYWCTYYHPAANVKIKTEGVKIYKAELNNAKDKVTLTEVEGPVIKAGQGVMLKASTSGALSMELTSTASSGNYSNNELLGGATVTAGYDAYTLAAVGGVMGFYKFAGAALNPNKAHLEILQTAGARTFYGFSDDATAMPSIDNGQLIIDNATDAEWYTLDGHRLSSQPTQKGIYVKQGQKIIVK